MKKKIINGIIIAAMAVIANYPLYNSLRSTATDIKLALDIVDTEIDSWKEDIKSVQKRVDVIQSELTETINQGLVQTEDALNKIKVIQVETIMLNNKVDSFQVQLNSKVKQIVEKKSLDLQSSFKSIIE
jgi:predicted  nucleic acid-binding Zn-ribbon protein